MKASETETEKVREESRATRPAGTAGAAQETRVSPGEPLQPPTPLISARGVVAALRARVRGEVQRCAGRAALAAPAGKKALASFEALECTPEPRRIWRWWLFVAWIAIRASSPRKTSRRRRRRSSRTRTCAACLARASRAVPRRGDVAAASVPKHAELQLSARRRNCARWRRTISWEARARQGPRPHARVPKDGLLAMGLVEACAGGGGRGLAGGAIQSSAGGSRAPRARVAGAGHFKQFRGIQLPSPTRRWRWRWRNTRRNRPGLPELLVHEGVRTATGF